MAKQKTIFLLHHYDSRFAGVLMLFFCCGFKKVLAIGTEELLSLLAAIVSAFAFVAQTTPENKRQSPAIQKISVVFLIMNLIKEHFFKLPPHFFVYRNPFISLLNKILSE